MHFDNFEINMDLNLHSSPLPIAIGRGKNRGNLFKMHNGFKIIKMKQKTAILFCSLLLNMTVSAQILEPAKWHYGISEKSIKKGDEVELIFTIRLDETWHLYANIQDYEIGPLPAEFNFEPDNTYKIIGDLCAVNYLTEYDEVFEVKVNYFENTAEFRQKVKILSNDPIIKGSYSYQVCSTVDGKCIFGEDDFEFKITTKTD